MKKINLRSILKKTFKKKNKSKDLKKKAKVKIKKDILKKKVGRPKKTKQEIQSKNGKIKDIKKINNKSENLKLTKTLDQKP